MSLLRRGSTRGWRLRQGEPAPLQGRPGRRCCTARERGWPPGPVRPAAPGSAGLEVRSVYPPFTAGVHKQVCALPSCSMLPALLGFAAVLTSDKRRHVTDVDPTLSHPLCRSCQGIEVGAVPALRAPTA